MRKGRGKCEQSRRKQVETPEHNNLGLALGTARDSAGSHYPGKVSRQDKLGTMTSIRSLLPACTLLPGVAETDSWQRMKEPLHYLLLLRHSYSHFKRLRDCDLSISNRLPPGCARAAAAFLIIQNKIKARTLDDPKPHAHGPKRLRA